MTFSSNHSCNIDFVVDRQCVVVVLTDNSIPSAQTDSPCSLASLDADTLGDLKLQLKSDLLAIMTKYSLYVRCIRQSLKDKGVSAEDLCSDLLTMPATNQAEQDLSLLSSHKAELEKAVSINGIFNFLTTEYASFLDYDIFEFMVETYEIDNGQEKLKYPQHLNDYLNKHKVSEFVEIKKDLLNISTAAASKELVLKFDIESTSKLAKIVDLKSAVAKSLGLRSATLRLLDIKDGCVVVTFLIPTPVAEIIFSKDTCLTAQQQQEFQAMAVRQLECNDKTFDFTTKNTACDEKSERRGIMR